jgi:hypothetical protein
MFSFGADEANVKLNIVSCVTPSVSSVKNFEIGFL